MMASVIMRMEVDTVIPTHTHTQKHTHAQVRHHHHHHRLHGLQPGLQPPGPLHSGLPSVSTSSSVFTASPRTRYHTRSHTRRLAKLSNYHNNHRQNSIHSDYPHRSEGAYAHVGTNKLRRRGTRNMTKIRKDSDGARTRSKWLHTNTPRNDMRTRTPRIVHRLQASKRISLRTPMELSSFSPPSTTTTATKMSHLAVPVSFPKVPPITIPQLVTNLFPTKDFLYRTPPSYLDDTKKFFPDDDNDDTYLSPPPPSSRTDTGTHSHVWPIVPSPSEKQSSLLQTPQAPISSHDVYSTPDPKAFESNSFNTKKVRQKTPRCPQTPRAVPALHRTSSLWATKLLFSSKSKESRSLTAQFGSLTGKFEFLGLIGSGDFFDVFRYV